tara:strand:+ start:8017 stop:8640 length:624 start_codon:yes stop_codon:yes gene_type:complete
MGLPVPVREAQLKVNANVKALSASAKTAKVTDTEHNIIQQNTSLVTHTKTDKFPVNKHYQQKTDNHRQMVIHAQDIMSKTVITLPENTLFSEAWQQFKQYRFRHFPVMNNDNKLVGIISDRDMLSSADFKQQNNTLHQPEHAISKIMTKTVLVASLKTNIREISRTMFSLHIGAIPIVDDEINISGLITRSDILRSIIKNEPMEFWV